MKNKKELLTTGSQLVAGALLLLLIFHWIPEIHPLPQTKFKTSRNQAIQLATEYLDGDIPRDQLKTNADFIIEQEILKNKNIVEQLIGQLGFQPYKYWQVELFSDDRKNLDLLISSDDENTVRRLSDEGYRAQISADGTVLSLNFREPRLQIFKAASQDSGQASEYSNEIDQEMRMKALQFLLRLQEDTTDLSLQEEETRQDSLGIIYDLTYLQQAGEDISVMHQINITHNGILLSYEKKVESGSLKESDEDSSVPDIVFRVTEAIIYFLLIILVLFYLIYFSRKESISFKIALPLSLFIGLITLTKSIFSLWHAPLLYILVGSIPMTLFYFLGMFLLYSASDAMTRLQWNEKLNVLDHFRQGTFLSKSAGISIRNGIFLGILSLAVLTTSLYIYIHIFEGSLSGEGDLEYEFSILFPIITVFLAGLNKALFNEIFFRLFGISTVARWFNKSRTLIIGTLVFSFIFASEIVPQNVFARYAIFLIPTFLFIYFFLKYEITTTLIGFLTYLLLFKGVIFYTTNEAFIQEMGFGILFIGIIVLIFAFSLIIFKRKESEFQSQYVPAYIRQMEEKERLIRELEIARNVQEKFLPLEIPSIPNYEIAAFCQPAWEVGGDYYDYFQLDKDRLGIAIGDVSNKGVSAAFYMTMVKGFLKSLSLHLVSPREILTQANTLFYENVERGNFISMVFGILDHQKNEFLFSRAGHNPLLVLFCESQTGQWLIPEGIAIGLTGTRQFKATIKEDKIDLQRGDVLVLYTDGYPESMNAKFEEFGEDQLELLIKNNTRFSAQEIIQRLEQQIRVWTAQRPASDDRTIVVIKRIH